MVENPHKNQRTAPSDESSLEDQLHYGHPRMPLSERAKIFAPFDSLRGFREVIEEQERKAAARQDL